MLPAEKEVSVFVVDDDEDDQFFMQQCFQIYFPGYSLSVFENGGQLLDVLETCQTLPALVLLDLNMPLMSGFEVLWRIRLNPKYDGLPVVILTTSNRDEDQKKAHELRAERFITKPTNLKDIILILNGLRQDFLEKKS